MRYVPGTMKPLLALSFALLASGCAHSTSPSIAFPSPADLSVPQKPQLSVDDVASAAALAEHNSAVEAWGDGMALQIGRLCRWANANGGDFTCPKPPDPG